MACHTSYIIASLSNIIEIQNIHWSHKHIIYCFLGCGFIQENLFHFIYTSYLFCSENIAWGHETSFEVFSPSSCIIFLLDPRRSATSKLEYLIPYICDNCHIVSALFSIRSLVTFTLLMKTAKWSSDFFIREFSKVYCYSIFNLRIKGTMHLIPQLS
jgi:hypothetical protein